MVFESKARTAAPNVGAYAAYLTAAAAIIGGLYYLSIGDMADGGKLLLAGLLGAGITQNTAALIITVAEEIATYLESKQTANHQALQLKIDELQAKLIVQTETKTLQH